MQEVWTKLLMLLYLKINFSCWCQRYIFKNSNFGPWYTKYSDKPIFTYITTGLDNDTDIDFLYRTEFPCVDAETGELFYGTGYIDSLNNLYSDADLNSSAMAKAESSEDFQQNTDEFITTEDAVNIINKKLGLNLKAKDFDFVSSIAEKNSKTAYFSEKDDISSFSVNDKGEVKVMIIILMIIMTIFP